MSSSKEPNSPLGWKPDFDGSRSWSMAVTLKNSSLPSAENGVTVVLSSGAPSRKAPIWTSSSGSPGDVLFGPDSLQFDGCLGFLVVELSADPRRLLGRQQRRQGAVIQLQPRRVLVAQVAG